ncbi:hypothetical protein ACVW1C_000072 [Bradyrhizobium sp. USDA 4011]
MNAARKLWLPAAVLIGAILPDSATAQTRQQCETIATAMPQLVIAIGGANKRISDLALLWQNVGFALLYRIPESIFQ